MLFSVKMVMTSPAGGGGRGYGHCAIAHGDTAEIRRYTKPPMLG